jgi:hypothetical protein
VGNRFELRVRAHRTAILHGLNVFVVTKVDGDAVKTEPAFGFSMELITINPTLSGIHGDLNDLLQFRSLPNHSGQTPSPGAFGEFMTIRDGHLCSVDTRLVRLTRQNVEFSTQPAVFTPALNVYISDDPGSGAVLTHQGGQISMPKKEHTTYDIYVTNLPNGDLPAGLNHFQLYYQVFTPPLAEEHRFKVEPPVLLTSNGQEKNMAPVHEHHKSLSQTTSLIHHSHPCIPIGL